MKTTEENMLDQPCVIMDRREFMQMLGKRTSPRKAIASRENGRRGGAYIETAETRENRIKAQRRRRENERRLKSGIPE